MDIRSAIEAFLVGFVFIAILVMVDDGNAQDKVKYCRKDQSGEIVVVEAGYPCPAGTHEA